MIGASLFPIARPKLFAAIHERLKEGYSLTDPRADLMAGAVVGLVALPLGRDGAGDRQRRRAPVRALYRDHWRGTGRDPRMIAFSGDGPHGCVCCRFGADRAEVPLEMISIFGSGSTRSNLASPPIFFR